MQTRLVWGNQQTDRDDRRAAETDPSSLEGPQPKAAKHFSNASCTNACCVTSQQGRGIVSHESVKWLPRTRVLTVDEGRGEEMHFQTSQNLVNKVVLKLSCWMNGIKKNKKNIYKQNKNKTEKATFNQQRRAIWREVYFFSTLFVPDEATC